MSRKWTIAIALLVALAVFIVLVAPGVDLPATVLQSLIYALVFLLLVRLPSLMAQPRYSRRAPAACAVGPPAIAPACPVSRLDSLRC